MKEKENLNDKLILHLFYNFIAFSIILLVFGIFIFFTVKHIIYRSVDNDLIESAKILTGLQSQYNIFLNFPNKIESFNIFLEQDLTEYQDYILSQKIKNPKIIMILRDENKEILNPNWLGRLSEYVNALSINDNALNKIYDLKIGDEYNYRGIDLKLDYTNDNADRYIQLLINVDSEYELMINFRYAVFSTVILGCLLSVIASYILSKHTLKPLQENIENQMEFIQNASHELRTPLTIIQAKQELLLKEPNAKIMDKSEEIILTLNETKRLTKLTKDLMILSRADSKSLNLQKENIDIDQFIENMLKPYVEIIEVQDKKMILNLEYKNEVCLDTNRIYQLLVIILDNAIKYTESGDTIEIHTFMKDNKCIIEIKDTGIGVSDEGLDKIFERFYREDMARNRETGGSGLGLSIASFIVSAHGGTIKASHNNPKGTIFTIKLPK